MADLAVAARLGRYARTTGYNAVINRRQFGLDELEWPVDYRYPDRVYRDRDSFSCGGLMFELRHALGETNDHTWVFVPERRTACHQGRSIAQDAAPAAPAAGAVIAVGAGRAFIIEDDAALALRTRSHTWEHAPVVPGYGSQVSD